MKSPFFLFIRATRKRWPGGSGIHLLLMLLATFVSPGRLWPQSAPPATSTTVSTTAPATAPDAQTLQALLQRIDQLEARVRQLEEERHEPAPGPARSRATLSHGPALAASEPAQQQSAPAATPSETPQKRAQPEQPAEPVEHAETERMDLSKTLLRIRGYGDVNLIGDNHHGDTTSFNLGELNLFVTSDVSEHFKFLSELIFEAEKPSNEFKVEPERILLQYSYNDYFSLSAGRYHTAIGYYNTAYHHSTWLQTTTGRPFLFAFEDDGGVLPVHNVGISASGRIPSGQLGLHYVAEVGNGRTSRTPLDEPVQNVVDENNHKAFNFAVFARPTKIPGLQTGFSVYRDQLTPLGQSKVSETILAAHAVYTLTNFEWLNEAVVIRHAPAGIDHVFETPGFYSQISQRFGSYRPYFRYQYFNASSNEPIFPDVGLRAGPSAGVRYDASESVALKLQYDFTALRNQPATQGLWLQVGFTF
jgi:hypothetical protein